MLLTIIVKYVVLCQCINSIMQECAETGNFQLSFQLAVVSG